ncbi:OmpA family protein [Rhizobium rhizogenes]
MGKRSRLFASAAFPLLSLSLAFEPVAAAALRDQAIMPLSNDAGGSVAVNGGASFEVAQEQPQGGQSEEELRKHKKPGEAEQGEPQGQKHEAAPAQQGGAEPQHKAKEAQPEAAPQPQKHQPEATPPKAAEPQAAPKQQQEQPAEKPPAQKPQAQPEAKPQPKAIEPQAQEPAPKPHKQPAEQQPTAQPEAKPQPKAAPETQQQGQPEQKQHQKPQGQPAEPAQQTAPAKQPAPAAQQPQAQQAQPETETQPAQKPHQKPQAQPAETAPKQKAPAQQPAEQQTAPAQQPAPAGQQPQGHKTQPETQAQPATEAAPGNQQGQKPGGDKAHGKPQQGQQGGEQPQPANETGAPAQGTATPAPANGTAQPNGAAQLGAETAVPASQPVSPQELERRKKIAENPAESKGPVILPVQNGAAVLDSDKDAARRGHRQGGQNPGGQGGAQAGQQGQAGQAPVGQGQAGQGQNAQTPPPAAYTKPPTSDAEAQRAAGGQQQPPVKMEAVTSEQGRRMDGRPNFTAPGGTTVQTIINQDNRTIVNVDNNYVVRHDDTERFVRGGERPTYEQLPRDRYRETIDQPDGDRIITVRNRYGDIIQRSRVDADGREYVLFYSPELEQQPDHDDYFRDPGDSLPPMRLLIPLSQYIIDTGTERDSDYYDFLREPPVEPVERIYSVNEVRYSARIRDKVRRIDLDTITFATGSAEIPMSQASTLRGVADAIGQIIKKDPTETFLIEGHTDAVGSAESNLILSDQRAESVAKVLSDVYGVPPENLVTQGYGEQYLKVNTQGPEQENRRVTIRRITALVRPVASNR